MSAGQMAKDKEAMRENDDDPDPDDDPLVADVESEAEPGIYHHGGTFYTVWSGEGDGQSDDQHAYQVDLSGDHPSCTCLHGEKKGNGQTEACWHIRAAVEAGPSQRTATQNMSQNTMELVSRAVEMQNRALQMTSDLRQAVTATEVTTAPESTAPENNDNGSESGSSQTEGLTPMDAADRLKRAFDEVTEDMQVKSTTNGVWVQTGKDTPDMIQTEGPGPDIDVFKSLLQDPDLIHFVGDEPQYSNFDHGQEKPGEWWKNALYPEDVPEYIEDVLGVDE